MSLILSCEHASGRVPARYAHAFSSRAAQKALATHRGLDLGALPLARELARHCGVPLLVGHQTRLLIDLNRSPGHRTLLSTWSRQLSPPDLAELEAIHAAHLQKLLESVKGSDGRAVHVAIHSFTPVLYDKPRNFDIGLLYDPSRKLEVSLANRLREAMLVRGLSVRRNAPYRGVSDCAPTWLRKRFAASRYVGLELEVNQALLWHQPDRAKRRALLAALGQVLGT